MAVATAVSLFGFLLLGGCGGKCENVISAQRLIRDQHRKASDGLPHAQLRLPHHRLNALFHEALKAQPVLVAIPLGSIPVPPASVSAKRIEITDARRGRIGFDIELEIQMATITLATFGATIDAKVRTVRSSAGTSTRTALEIGFDGDSLRQFRPKIPNAIAASAGAALANAVKKVSGTELPTPIANALASRIINQVTTSAFEVIRDQVLARIGELTKLRIELGNVPIERALARTDGRRTKSLVVDLWSTLPVANGLRPDQPGAEPISGTGQLRIAGQALAELGNWAIAEKLAPQQYNSDLKPDPDGAYVPVYRWRGDSQSENPLVIHVFRVEPPCSTITVSARPSAEVIDGSVSLSIKDGNIENVEGSSIMRLGVGLKELFGGSVARTETGTSSARLVIGDRPVLVQLLEASIDNLEFRSVIELSVRQP